MVSVRTCVIYQRGGGKFFGCRRTMSKENGALVKSKHFENGIETPFGTNWGYAAVVTERKVVYGEV